MTLSPLRREVEPPRQQSRAWVPVTMLGTTSLLTIAMAVAVATPPRVHDEVRLADDAIARMKERETSVCMGPRAASTPVVTSCDLEWKLGLDDEGCELDGRSDAGVSHLQLTRAADQQLPAIAKCMGEWDDRHGRRIGPYSLTIRIRVERDGRAHVRLGIGEEKAKACLVAAIDGLQLPPTDARTEAMLTISYVDAQTSVTMNRRGVIRPLERHRHHRAR